MRGSWQQKKLVEVATLQRGFDLPTKDRVSGSFPLVSSSGVIDTHNEGPIDGPGVVTGRSGSVGNVFFVEGSYWPLNTVLYVKDFHGNDPKFVYHLLIHLNPLRFASGAGVPTLNRNTIHEEVVLVPNLPEQRRIVAILDKAFENIAIARANAEKNLQNAQILQRNHIEDVFAQKQVSGVTRPLQELVESNLIGLTRSARDQSDHKEYPYVKMNNITPNNRFDFSNYVRVDASKSEAQRFTLEAGDFLFNTRNSYELVGKACIYRPVTDAPTVFNNNIMRIRFHTGIDPKFVLYAFSTATVREMLRGMKSGTTNVSAIYYKDLRSLSLPNPDLVTQRKAVERLDAVSTEAGRLESIYRRKLAALDELKQSLLHQAFSGQL